MKVKIADHRSFKYFFWFLGAVLCLVNLPGAPLLEPWIPNQTPFYDLRSQQTLKDLERLGLKNRLKEKTLNDLLYYQFHTGSSLPQTLKQPEWAAKLGLTPHAFKVTWYISNPFEVLPRGLQRALRKRAAPFQSATQMMAWSRVNKFPPQWREALKAALIETTPENLLRAAQGKRPYAKNGKFLKPIVIDHGEGNFEVQDGHIATDPRVIPTNSDVYLLLKVNGVDRILKVRAADVGGKIRGRHVDLPIHVGPSAQPMPDTHLPCEIRNPQVFILMPTPPRVSRGQKA
ncbi:MAG: hypothetical protein LHV69_02895 [Elusimicrobia bacterium]|nr:hypothetical protein [Candidatus Obscuribacterium magneticum]